MPSSHSLLNQSLQSLRAQTDDAVKALHELTVHIGNEPLAQTVSELRNRINDPFMFVIVGEVKAGKSSFVNALLESREEITAVAPQPMTDTIQQIVYGPEKTVSVIHPYLKRIEVPVDILRDIALVDTPGTNTIIEHHQEITERFIPASDLVVFVFEAKNPYRESAWQFFQFIHQDWRKKVVFVLQQKDLLPEEDLSVNLARLAEYAEKKGVHQPLVFAVSAKWELEGDQERSGFPPVRAYIRENITGGKAPLLKLESSLQTSLHLLDTIRDGLALRRKQWEKDAAFRKDIAETLQRQETLSNRQVDILIENLIAGYDRITASKDQALDEGLSLFPLLYRSFLSVFNKQSSAQHWLEETAHSLEQELNQVLQARLQEGIGDLADSVQQMARLIDLKIRTSETVLQNNHEIFSAIAEKRSHVFRDLQEAFEDFIRKGENFSSAELFPEKTPLPGTFATGSGLAVIGIALTALTHGMVFDITGGVLTAVGILFAGVASASRRKKILLGFREEIRKGRERISEEVSGQLKRYIHRLKERIDSHFDPFDVLLEKEAAQLDKLEIEQRQVQTRLQELEHHIARLLKQIEDEK